MSTSRPNWAEVKPTESTQAYFEHQSPSDGTLAAAVNGGAR